MIPYAHTPEGLLTVVDTIYFHVASVCPDKRGVASEQQYNPSLVYDNYCKDNRSWQYYGCSYEDYMLAIIDTMINGVEQSTCEVEPFGSGTDIGSHDIEQSCLNKSSDAVIPSLKHTYDDTPLAPQTSMEFSYDSSSQNRDIPRLIRDFNYPNKTVGYLAQENTEFDFMGPDRQPVAITSLPQLLDIADIVRSIGFPNYKVARIPISSGLNVKAWECHLQDYSDKRVLQYIKFGFPLSLTNASELGNKEVTTHYSASQYPGEVQKYIDKEKSAGALLGPVKNIVHEQYYCSPLMTRPKDNGSRHVMLDLSYPCGHSVNSHVHKDKFCSQIPQYRSHH